MASDPNEPREVSPLELFYDLVAQLRDCHIRVASRQAVYLSGADAVRRVPDATPIATPLAAPINSPTVNNCQPRRRNHTRTRSPIAPITRVCGIRPTDDKEATYTIDDAIQERIAIANSA